MRVNKVAGTVAQSLRDRDPVPQLRSCERHCASRRYDKSAAGRIPNRRILPQSRQDIHASGGASSPPREMFAFRASRLGGSAHARRFFADQLQIIVGWQAFQRLKRGLARRAIADLEHRRPLVHFIKHRYVGHVDAES